jgi:hypothetical protein
MLTFIVLTVFMEHVIKLHKKQIQAYLKLPQNTEYLGYELESLELGSQQRKENFLFYETSRAAVGPTQSPIQWVPRYFAGCKAVGARDWPLTYI